MATGTGPGNDAATMIHVRRAVVLVLAAPAEAGRLRLLLDIVEDGTRAFRKEGSPLATCDLVVTPAPRLKTATTQMARQPI